MTKNNTLKTLERRRATLISIYYLAGIVSGDAIIEKGYIYLAIPLVIIYISIYLLNISKKHFIVYLFGILVILVANRYFLIDLDQYSQGKGGNGNDWIKGTVKEVTLTETGSRILVKIHSQKVLIYCNDNNFTDMGIIGKYIEFKGDIKIPDGSSNPGSFNYKKYLFGKGIGRVSYYPEIIIQGESGSLILKLRRWLTLKRDFFLFFLF